MLQRRNCKKSATSVAKRGARQEKVIGSHFPDYLYISTTSKQDRYSFHPIHRRTRLYPHHGVPVLGSDRVDIVYLIEDAPFYFLKGKQHIEGRGV